VYSDGKSVYTTSHVHACETIGSMPQASTSPGNLRHAEAYTAVAKGTLTRSPHVNDIYADWSGYPAPAAVNWFPEWLTGTASGQGQAGWSVTGNGDFISVGGEFPGVNNQGQRGLVRFARRPATGAKQAPRLSGDAWTPTATSVRAGQVRVSIPANWDRDDLDLSYELLREGTAAPVATAAKQSTYYNQPRVQLVDGSVTAGQSHTYRVRASDGDGNTATSAPVSVTVSTAELSGYALAVLDDGATTYWRLGGTSTVKPDLNGVMDADSGSGLTETAGAIHGDSDPASQFSGDGSAWMAGRDTVATPGEFSTELWFKTATNRGGKLIGYGRSKSDLSSSYDRHVYMHNDGRLTFGAYPGGVRTVTTPASYNDDQWHHVVATQGPSGTYLYVDGTLQASDGSLVSGEGFTGYWRVGGDNLNGWTSQPSSHWFAGSLDEVAVYPAALADSTVRAHYDLGTGAHPPAAAFTALTDDLTASFDASGTTLAPGRSATPLGYRWDFGDDSDAGTGVTPEHTYAAAGTYTVTLTVTDNTGSVGQVSREVTVTAPHAAPVASFQSTASGWSAAFDGTGSSAGDGATIDSYAWDFGDGTTSTQPRPNHVYDGDGSYDVTLRVTDSQGATGEVTRTVVVAHEKPVADIAHQGEGLRVDLDGTGSSASDGATVESYAWDLGDGTSSTQARPTHVYEKAGSYDVTLRVTDSQGATGETTKQVEVTHADPVAAFETSVSATTLSVDAAGSAASDGASLAYSWSWGDGSDDGSGGTATHTYEAAGSYDVTLTVTDSLGGTDEVTETVTVEEQAYAAKDAFGRSVGSGWGAADKGGAWTGTAGLSVSGEAGRISLGKSQTRTVTLPVAVRDTVSRFTVSADKVADGGGMHLNYLVHRSTAGDYRLKLRFSSAGVVNVGVAKTVGTTESLVANKTLTGYTFKAGTKLEVRFETATTGGSTRLRAKLWPHGGSEPSDWWVTATDAQAALQGAGQVGFSGYGTGTMTNGPVTLAVDDLTVVDPAAGPHANPVAVIGSTVSGLSVAFDGTGSTTSDGATVASYEWSFGDGESSSAAAPTHRFARPGTYAVTLRVTDSTGAASTVATKEVTVSHADPVASFTASAQALTVGVDASASTASDGATLSYAWAWGDGTAAGSGPTASHTYAAPGTYTVALTVTDTLGATHRVTRDVVVTEQQLQAGDAFGRSVSAGWGTADVGGAWTTPATGFSVAGGVGRISLGASQTRTATLAGSLADTVSRFAVTTDKVANGGGTHLNYLVHRGSAGDYRLKLRFGANGVVNVGVAKLVGTTETLVANRALTGYTHTAGSKLQVLFEVTKDGSNTRLRAKVWAAGQTEPTAWTVSATDAQATLQGAGQVGFSGYAAGTMTNGPVVISVDDLTVG
jgi:PKD repeat protein